PDRGLAGGGAGGQVDVQPGGEERPDERAGDGGPPQLLEHERGLREPEAHAAGALGQGHREHAHATQLAPQVPVDGAGHLGDGAAGVVVDPLGEEAAQLGLQGDLVVGRFEVHRPAPQRSLGRPSRRSPTMLRWIWAVPAAIDSDSAYSRWWTWSRWRADTPVGSSRASRARPRMRSATSPIRSRVSW